MTQSSRRLALAVVVALAGAKLASAQTTQNVYNNVTTFTGNYFTPGGATTSATTSATLTDADDITLAAGATGAISSMTWSVVNVSGASVSVRPIVTIYAVGGTGLPGAILTQLTFNPTTFTNGTITTQTYTPGGIIFSSATPTASPAFYAGLTFDNGGTSTATTTQLNGFGEGIFNPPTIGSSNDSFFQSTNNTAYSTASPAGGLVSFGGNPKSNFGWSFTGLSTAPEPSAALLALPGALLTFGAIARRRQLVS